MLHIGHADSLDSHMVEDINFRKLPTGLNVEEWRIFCTDQGTLLADLLYNQLPGATLDIMLSQLLKLKASQLRLHHYRTTE